MITQAKRFQKEVVRKWNPSIDDPTTSMYLGLVGIDESAAKECGAITLDLLLRAGVLEQEEDGSWILAEGWDKRRIYLYGDAKTVENISKFVRDMQLRRITYTQANLQADVFLQAMSVVMEIPGDWHTSLNMLQSIYTLYYDGFLDGFQELLKFKRIGKDIRSCYFQASRLVKLVHNELMRFFIHSYVSSRSESHADQSDSDECYVGRVTTEFMEYLDELRTSDDAWISSCANFLSISFDFIEFETAFRVGDSISLEAGYQRHVPIWIVLGQHKYEEIFYSQQECLYRDNPFSRLQELRINRVVRRYAGILGKRCVAHDEFLENGNHFFSQFSLPSSLRGFEQQSWMVGIGLMCKRFTNRWYSSGTNTTAMNSYKPSVASKMLPEMKLIYQVFGLLNTHIILLERTKFYLDFVTSCKDEIDIDLRRETLEKSMHEREQTSADNMFDAVNNVYIESIDNAGIDPTLADGDDEGEMDPVDAAANSEETRPMADNAPTTKGKSKSKKIRKKEMHVNISSDVRTLGDSKLVSRDIIRKRAARARVQKVKSNLREAIMNSISEMKSREENTSVGSEMSIGVSPWHWHTRNSPNSLDLRYEQK